MIEKFKKDVDAGLSASRKFLPSEYFYDATGDALFRQIMALPEYYLTRAELEIFTDKTRDLIEGIDVCHDRHFELVELGPGDGSKTIKLLEALHHQGYDFVYRPIDISQNALDHLANRLNAELPALKVISEQGHYFEVLASLNNADHKKVVLFLGSNIGNMEDSLASDFIYQLGANLKPDDILLLGVDQKKSRDIVLPAYDDAKGITAQFNLNLLARINRDLGADFNLGNFKHQPEYCEIEGMAKSYLTSLVDQTVHIKSLNKSYAFARNEKIHTEISRKYDDDSIRHIIDGTDFTLDSKITDSNNYLADYILTRR